MCVAVAALPASAQHYVGLTGGYGAAQGRFYPAEETSMTWGKMSGGVAWKYYSPQQVVGGVGAELLYMARGYRIDRGNMSTIRTVNSITMPLIWQPHLYFARRHLRVFVNAAFTFTYNLGVGDTVTELSRVIVDGKVVSQSSIVTPYKMIAPRDGRWNYGIMGGAGFGVLFGRWEVAAEARYYYGMSDILRTQTRYMFNDYIRSELDNLSINLSVYFRLGKGGITEPPLRRTPAPPPGDGDFRNIKLDNMRY
jgi:hypothetical protein